MPDSAPRVARQHAQALRPERSFRRIINEYRPLLAGDDRGAGEADEEAALKGAWDVFDLYL